MQQRVLHLQVLLLPQPEPELQVLKLLSVLRRRVLCRLRLQHLWELRACLPLTLFSLN